MPPKKRKRLSIQIPLTKAGLSIKSKGEKWKDADLLLTDDIYTRVPDEAKGKYFWYKVIGYDDFGISKAFIGTLAPHITTEVDCESLFSQAGHAAHPNRNRTISETFERLAMGKHGVF